MSRVGRLPIELPSGVQVTVKEQTVSIKGPKGQMDFTVPEPITITLEDKSLSVQRPDDEKKNKALHGTSRAILANIVHGVSQGFTRELEINGVGYRAAAKGKILNLELGYSHPIDFPLPEGVTAEVEKNTMIKLSSINKELLGETAARIRKLRPPEPYKGKGVKYIEEHIVRKVGKRNV